MEEVRDDVLERLKSWFIFCNFFLLLLMHYKVNIYVSLLCYPPAPPPPPCFNIYGAEGGGGGKQRNRLSDTVLILAPLITLMTASSPEISLTLLQHIELLLTKKPTLFGMCIVCMYKIVYVYVIVYIGDLNE